MSRRSVAARTNAMNALESKQERTAASRFAGVLLTLLFGLPLALHVVGYLVA
jgi:hypothetical protein